MNVLSHFILIFTMMCLIEGTTLVIKKNRKYNNPPLCFAYVREYTDEDKTTSCSGYQFDCFDVQSDTQIGKSVNFDTSNCESISLFRKFSDSDFETRLDEATRFATTIGFSRK